MHLDVFTCLSEVVAHLDVFTRLSEVVVHLDVCTCLSQIVVHLDELTCLSQIVVHLDVPQVFAAALTHGAHVAVQTVLIGSHDGPAPRAAATNHNKSYKPMSQSNQTWTAELCLVWLTPLSAEKR